REALDSAVIALEAAGVDTPRLDAEVLLADVLGADRAALIAHPARELEPDETRRFQAAARRRVQREPVAYITGRRGFRGIELAVDRRVLIPRPETEHVVEAALGLPRRARVVDVGTGSGAIALALKAERPDLDVVATDADAGALDVARVNAARLGLDVAFVHGDLLAGVEADAVLSNPPYVADGTPLMPEIARWEPRVAVFSGGEGLTVVRRLVPAAAEAGARFIALEVGAGQAAAVADLVRAAGFAEIEVVPDLAGIERVVVGRAPSPRDDREAAARAAATPRDASRAAASARDDDAQRVGRR
ncbi:MAG TPA: peptide chain release factor N(5)-glutamine methyltransferase, partial [Solirubrobacteraceae bacterium]